MTTLLGVLPGWPFCLGARLAIQAVPNTSGSGHDYQTVHFLNAVLTTPDRPGSATSVDGTIRAAATTGSGMRGVTLGFWGAAATAEMTCFLLPSVAVMVCTA